MAGVILSLMCLTCYAETNGAVKISFGGDVKEAKEVADGKGVSFSLPELADNEFYIYAIELAVFEKQNGETSWHTRRDRVFSLKSLLKMAKQELNCYNKRLE